MFQDKETRRAALEKLHLKNAEQIVGTMGQLKGAAMKVGQQFAQIASTVDLPEEVQGVLGKLHDDVEPVPWETVERSIVQSLGEPIAAVFAEIDPSPLGTASLGQAHAARLPDGSEVVVKVLHDGIEATVGADLAALKALLATGVVIRRDKKELDEAFAEVRARLDEELDYLHEAANIHAYTQAYGDDPRLRIPRVHVDYSTERVLTMDRLPGEHIDAFLKHATPEAKQRAGLTVAEFYYEQVFRHRMLHSDPHPGNYLFEPDGRLGVLDFGCVKRFDEFWIGTYARAALAVTANDKAEALRLLVELGAWDGKNPRAGDALWDFVHAIGRGFASGPIELGGEGEHYLEDMKPMIRNVIPHPNIRAPKDVIMLHRSLGGLYAMGRKLRTKTDFGLLLEQHAQFAIDRADGRS